MAKETCEGRRKRRAQTFPREPRFRKADGRVGGAESVTPMSALIV